MSGNSQSLSSVVTPNVAGEFARVAVIGTSCAGKTTFARAFCGTFDAPHVELDSLYWGPNWTPRPTEEFRAAVDAATAAPRWVCDGNYHSVRDLVWRRATAIVWLNYPFGVVMSRALRRTWDRCRDQTLLYAGNRESFRKSFFSSDSILLWVLRTHWRRQREVPKLLGEDEYAHLKVVDLRSPDEARVFLAKVAATYDQENMKQV